MPSAPPYRCPTQRTAQPRPPPRSPLLSPGNGDGTGRLHRQYQDVESRAHSNNHGYLSCSHSVRLRVGLEAPVWNDVAGPAARPIFIHSGRPVRAMIGYEGKPSSRLADGQQGLDGAALVHGGVGLGDVVEVGGVVEDEAGVDLAGE